MAILKLSRHKLLSKECGINAMDTNGKTPIHLDTYEGKPEAALELIRFGAKKAIADSKFGTPLHE